MSKPQTIQIFLPEGNPRGVKIAEITTRVVQAIAFPRKELLNLGKRDELKNVGIYFLFGEDETKSKQLAYIGEAEDCYDRIKNHKLNKEFWTHAIVFISQKNAFTKGHVKFLFKAKYLFGSPSTAAGVVLGRNSNGWKNWKSGDGKTRDELKRQ